MANVKTAISIQEALFKQINTLAHKMHISRSRLFSIAVVDFLQRYQNLQLLQQINAVYSNSPALNEKKYQSRAKSRYKKLVEGEW